MTTLVPENLTVSSSRSPTTTTTTTTNPKDEEEFKEMNLEKMEEEGDKEAECLVPEETMEEKVMKDDNQDGESGSEKKGKPEGENGGDSALDLSYSAGEIPVKKRRVLDEVDETTPNNNNNNNNNQNKGFSSNLIERTAPVVENSSCNFHPKAFEGVAIQDVPLALTKNEK